MEEEKGNRKTAERAVKRCSRGTVALQGVRGAAPPETNVWVRAALFFFPGDVVDGGLLFTLFPISRASAETRPQRNTSWESRKQSRRSATGRRRTEPADPKAPKDPRDPRVPKTHQRHPDTPDKRVRFRVRGF